MSTRFNINEIKEISDLLLLFFTIEILKSIIIEGQKTGESKISIKYAKHSFLHGIPRLENNGFQPESPVFESFSYIPAKTATQPQLAISCPGMLDTDFSGDGTSPSV